MVDKIYKINSHNKEYINKTIFDNGNNPLETDLNRFGYNVSVICETHYVPADKVQIQLERF